MIGIIHRLFYGRRKENSREKKKKRTAVIIIIYGRLNNRCLSKKKKKKVLTELRHNYDWQIERKTFFKNVNEVLSMLKR